MYSIDKQVNNYISCKWNFQERIIVVYLLKVGKFWWLTVNFLNLTSSWRLAASKMADILIWIQYWIRAIRPPVVLSNNYVNYKKAIVNFFFSDDSALERENLWTAFCFGNQDMTTFLYIVEEVKYDGVLGSIPITSFL